MASIYKRITKTGQTVYYGAFRVNGKLIRRKLGLSLQVARKALKKMEYELTFSTPNNKINPIQITKGILGYLKEYETSGVKYDQVYQAKLKLHRFEEYCKKFGVRNLHDINVEMAKVYIAKRTKTVITNNYKSLNLSDNQNALEYAQAVFDKIPNQPIPSLLKGRIYYPNQAIIIADNEQHVFSLWYLLYGTKSNKKVMVISSRLLQFDWYIEQIRNQYPFQIPRNSTTNFTAHERLKNIINHNQDNVDIFFTYQTVLFPQTQEGLIYRLETAR